MLEGRKGGVQSWEFDADTGARGVPFPGSGSLAARFGGGGRDVGEAEAGEVGAGGVAFGAGVG